MGRRSLVKRIARGASKMTRITQKQLGALENKINETCNHSISEDVKKEVDSFKTHEELAEFERLQKKRMREIQIGLIPRKIDQMKNEIETLQYYIRNIGESTIGDVAYVIAVIFAFYVIFNAGVIVGRGDINGYPHEDKARQFDEESKEK